MDIPPIIPQEAGKSQAIPPKLADIPPRKTQSKSQQAAGAPPVISAPPGLPRSAPKPNISAPREIPRRLSFKPLIVGFCLLLLLFAVIYVYGTLYAPRHCMRALASAMDRNDRETVEEYVDAPALAESFRSCALELYRRQQATNNSNDFGDRLLNPLWEGIASWVINATFTPDSVISMMCGEDPSNAMKQGMENQSDNTVDAITRNGGPKIKVYGLLGKVLINWAVGYAADETSEDTKTNQAEMNPDDYVATTQYESLNRILITVAHRSSDGPSLGFVLKRHGLVTWKFSELRLLPQKRQPPLAAHWSDN